MVLEKTLESSLDSKIKPVNLKGNQPRIFIGRTDAEAEVPILWPLEPRADSSEKKLRPGKIEGGRRRGRWKRRWLDGITNSMDMGYGWTPGVGDGQGGLGCCGSWDRKE